MKWNVIRIRTTNDATDYIAGILFDLGFDGIEVTPEGVENISQIGEVLAEMRRRGYSDNDILKVSGQNLLAVMCRVVKCSELSK